MLADPKAGGPRIDYAVRLAESAHPADQARSEFIRLQLELAKTPETDSRWPAMVGRERDLLVLHRLAREKPLRDLFRPSFTSPGRWRRAIRIWKTTMASVGGWSCCGPEWEKICGH
ncbi:MAG: hypothetical protein EXS09_17590 [Gemmataceae bacterium]|nr:hypothetical protein [Gemmataceae bacterium]